MRKKLDTRFPAARIKKIMQVDEEVGKIALSTPVLVSKALELFLQDVLDRTYSIMRDRGGKTLSSGHLKLCLEQHKEYDFLKDLAATITETVSEAPRAAASLEGPGSTSMGRGRRKRSEGEDRDAEDSGDNIRRGVKVRREHSGVVSPPGVDWAAGPRISMKRQSSTSSTRSDNPVEFQPTLHVRKLEEVATFTSPPPKVEEIKHEASGPKVAGFDLNFDLNASPDLEESPVKVDVPAQKTACDSDDDYDAE